MFIDTTFCIDLMRERHKRQKGPASTKLTELGETPLFVAVFVICELQAGARMAKNPLKELRKVEILSEKLEIVYPDSTFPIAYGEAEATLRSQGIPIPVMDLLIGVTAKTHGIPLLTRDTSHFKTIPDLVLEEY